MAKAKRIKKELFGEHNRYALFPFFSERFQETTWFIEDALIPDEQTGLPSVIYQGDEARARERKAELIAAEPQDPGWDEELAGYPA